MLVDRAPAAATPEQRQARVAKAKQLSRDIEMRDRFRRLDQTRIEEGIQNSLRHWKKYAAADLAFEPALDQARAEADKAVAAFKKMVKKADVVVENFRPDVKRRLGIDYEALSAVNPAIIRTANVADGEEDPRHDRLVRLRLARRSADHGRWQGRWPHSDRHPPDRSTGSLYYREDGWVSRLDCGRAHTTSA